MTHQHGKADGREVYISYKRNLEIRIGRNVIRAPCLYLEIFANEDSMLFEITHKLCQLYRKDLKGDKHKKLLKMHKTRKFLELKLQNKGKINGFVVTSIISPTNVLEKNGISNEELLDIQSRMLEKDMGDVEKQNSKLDNTPQRPQKPRQVGVVRVTKPLHGGYRPWTIGDYRPKIASL